MGSESDMVESGNVTYEDVEASTGRQVIYIVLYTALLVLIVFGNCFLLFVIAKDRTLKRSTRIFLISLTVADIFVGVVVIPLKVVPQIIGLSSVSPWTVSDRLCNASYFLEIFASSASVLGVLVLTIERYLAVEIPLRFRSIMTARRACIIVACSWLLSAVPAASFVVMSAAAEKGITAFNEFSWRCAITTLPQLSVFAFLFFVILYLLAPTCVSLVASIRILFIVKRHTEYQKQLTLSSRDSDWPSTSGAKKSHHGICSGVCRGLCKCFLVNKKALITVLIITISYSASSLPFAVCVIYMKFSPHQIDSFLVEFSRLSLYSSCFINVVVYTIRMRAFRASALRQISQCLPVRSNLCRGKLVKPKSVNRVTKSDTGDSRM